MLFTLSLAAQLLAVVAHIDAGLVQFAAEAADVLVQPFIIGDDDWLAVGVQFAPAGKTDVVPPEGHFATSTSLLTS